jgi:hypothetical protein
MSRNVIELRASKEPTALFDPFFAEARKTCMALNTQTMVEPWLKVIWQRLTRGKLKFESI